MAEPKADRLTALEELRDLLKGLLDDEDNRPSAAMVRQYRDTLREIDELTRGTKKGSLVDELAKRRARKPAAKDRTPARRRRSDKGA